MPLEEVMAHWDVMAGRWGRGAEAGSSLAPSAIAVGMLRVIQKSDTSAIRLDAIAMVPIR